MKVRAVISVVLTAAVACTTSTTIVTNTPTGTPSANDVVRMQLIPIPEGDSAPIFGRTASPAGVAGPGALLLDTVRRYIPDPLPAPLKQPEDCSFGGNLVMTLADGTAVTYGPCLRPASVNRLWAAMVYVMTRGDCAPGCGPGWRGVSTVH